MFLPKHRVLLVILVIFLICEVNSKGGRGGRGKSGSKSSLWSFFNWFRSSPKSSTTSSHSSHTSISASKLSNRYGAKPNSNQDNNNPGRVPPYGGPPPPYPGLGSAKHSPPDLQPPPYSQTGGQFTNSRTHHHHHYRHHSSGGYGGGYYRNPYGYSNQNFNKSTYSAQNPTPWGRHGNPVYGPFGVGGNRGYSLYGAGFGFGKQSSNSGSFGSHVGTFIAGAMLWNLANEAGGNNYHLFHNTQKKNVNVGQNEDINTEYKINSNMNNLNEAKIEVDLGNMTCLTIYNAKRFSEWANNSIKQVEAQTNQSFPFNLNINETSVQFNFTLEPGEIKHNETISITCCGAKQIYLDYEDALKGHDPSTNCVHMTATIPFRDIKVVPLNRTFKVTQKEIDDLDKPPSVDKITLNLDSAEEFEEPAAPVNGEHITLNLDITSNFDNIVYTSPPSHYSNSNDATERYIGNFVSSYWLRSTKPPFV